MKNEISIAIITKNRKKELTNCLNSILHQTQKPKIVVIIDNDSNQSAKKMITYKKYKTLKISYYSLLGSVPKCRNFAIKKTKGKYLGFTDDDCILDKHWVENGIDTIDKNNPDFILGKTLLLNPNNIFALAQHNRDDYWKNQNSQIFDTKNAILNLASIRKRKLQFDEACQKEAYDSADFDFDFTLKKNGLNGVYCKNMIVRHQETSNLQRFLRRAYFRGYLAKYLDKKWQLQNQLVDLSTHNSIIWLLKLIKNYRLDYSRYTKSMSGVSILTKILAILVIKIFELYYVLGYVANQKNN